MSCDVGEVTERLENELYKRMTFLYQNIKNMGGLPGDLSEEPVT